MSLGAAPFLYLAENRPEILLAILALLDAVGGFSSYLAVRLKMKGQQDAILMWLLLICFLVFKGLHAYELDYFYLYANDGLKLGMNILDALAIGAMVICPLLARSKGRSFFLWLALGFLGNVGAIIWLLVSRYRHETAAA